MKKLNLILSLNSKAFKPQVAFDSLTNNLYKILGTLSTMGKQEKIRECQSLDVICYPGLQRELPKQVSLTQRLTLEIST